MPSADQELRVYECRSCGELRLAPAGGSCCEGPMDAVEESVQIESPDVERIMREVFGMTGTELAVCHCVMESGESTVDELAAELDRDRSVITRHVNHLAELGLVEKESRIRSGGGRINVYSPVSEDRIRRQLMLGVYSWLAEAVALVDGVSEEKIEAMARRHARSDDGADGSIFRRIFHRDGSP